MIVQSFRNGWRTAHTAWGLALVLWVGNALIAAGVTWLVASRLEAAAGQSLALGVLSEGYNYTILADLRQQGFLFKRMFLGALLVAAPLSVLLNTVLTGGILAVVLQNSRFSLWHFAASSVAYAGRFVRLLVLGALMLLVLAMLLALLVWASASAVSTEKDLAELAGAALVVLVVFSGLMWTALDYARVWIVRDHMSSARRALWRGFRLVAEHPLATGALQLTAVALVAATVALQVITGMPFGIESTGGIFAVVLLHQCAVMARCVVRLALIASQVHLTNFVVLPPTEEER